MTVLLLTILYPLQFIVILLYVQRLLHKSSDDHGPGACPLSNIVGGLYPSFYRRKSDIHSNSKDSGSFSSV
ncbi:hypothetical protein RCIA115 [Methanocella arvoryzae MRE50]|uniref:Uncharacterized protein n=1 Tax=Methanocella arvoryzae (strain DSM 22066 / NBRC 105507 / MRE50) TaxID=351160 RepID=Q0W4F9_METAR|nr:hypothetical protein RCIA115 [Methanocella arvoryzae MRE50]